MPQNLEHAQRGPEREERERQGQEFQTPRGRFACGDDVPEGERKRLPFDERGDSADEEDDEHERAPHAARERETVTGQLLFGAGQRRPDRARATRAASHERLLAR